jgi:hypothetical protein
VRREGGAVKALRLVASWTWLFVAGIVDDVREEMRETRDVR